MQSFPSVVVCRLYERTSRGGKTYLVGRIGSARAVLLQDEPTADGTPVWCLFLQEALPKDTSDRTPARSSRVARPRRAQPGQSALALPNDRTDDLWTDRGDP